MDSGGWHKTMSYFSSMCFYSPLDTQVLFYDGHGKHLDDREFYIPWRHNIQSFVLQAGDYVNDHPKNNGQIMKLKNLYGDSVINWMRHHGTLKFTPPHINYFLIEIWEDLKISSAKITQKYFKRTPHPPIPTIHWNQPPILYC